MSLSCLTCGNFHEHDFENEFGNHARNGRLMLSCCGLERNWSGNISPPRYRKIRNECPVGIDNKKGHHRRTQTAAGTTFDGDCSPRLSRSGGVRRERNWSGNLSPPRYRKIRNETSVGINNMKGHHRRAQTIAGTTFDGNCSPRLSRSGGMRRDWSLEDVRKAGYGNKNLREGVPQC